MTIRQECGGDDTVSSKLRLDVTYELNGKCELHTKQPPSRGSSESLTFIKHLEPYQKIICNTSVKCFRVIGTGDKTTSKYLLLNFSAENLNLNEMAPVSVSLALCGVG